MVRLNLQVLTTPERDTTPDFEAPCWKAQPQWRICRQLLAPHTCLPCALRQRHHDRHEEPESSLKICCIVNRAMLEHY